MKVLIYTAFPPLAGQLLGGAQRSLDALLRVLAGSDVELIVVCPPANGRKCVESGRLLIVDQLRALVELEHAERVGPADVHHDMRLLCRLASAADVVVSVDEHFPVEVDVPVILWLNNFSYPPETRSVFGLSWDAVVVPSEYVSRCLMWYLPPESWQSQQPDVHVIPPVATLPPVRRKDSSRNADHQTLIFPHRPDPDKGFETALLATRELVRRSEQVRLLIPEPGPGEIWPHQVRYTNGRRKLIADHGLGQVVTLHHWIGSIDIPGYLANATWTLCPSELPESFGLTVAESLAMGTPVIATPAGALGELLPDGHGVEMIEFGDWRAMADIIAKGPDIDAVERGRSYVTRTFTAERCAKEWLRVLDGTAKFRGRYTPPDLGGEPPWRRRLGSGRVWDDYAKRYIKVGQVGR